MPAAGLYIIKSGVVNIVEPMCAGSNCGHYGKAADGINMDRPANSYTHNNAKITQRYAGATFAGSSLVEEWSSNVFQANANSDCELMYVL